MGGGPRPPPIPVAPPPLTGEPAVDALSLSRQRRTLQLRRKTRDSLRLDPATNAGGDAAGLSVPKY